MGLRLVLYIYIYVYVYVYMCIYIYIIDTCESDDMTRPKASDERFGRVEGASPASGFRAEG